EHARLVAGFKPGAFDPFIARLPVLLAPPEGLTYEGYLSHGLADLVERFVIRYENRWMLATYLFPTEGGQTSRVQAIVDEVDGNQSLTGLTLVNGELARRFLPQFLRGLAIGSAIVAL